MTRRAGSVVGRGAASGCARAREIAHVPASSCASRRACPAAALAALALLGASAPGRALALDAAVAAARRAPAQDSGASAAAAPAAAGETRDAIVARWREDYELDELARILAEGPALVTGEGALARDGEAIAIVARALFASGREGTARSLLAAPVALDEDGRAQVELARATIALAEDDLAGALAILLDDEGGVRHAHYPDAWLLAGQALARAGNRDAADQYLARFLELAPYSADLPAACHMLAQHAIARRDAERARAFRARGEEAARWQAVMRARRLQVRASPDDPLPRFGLAQLWFEAREPARAKAELERVLALAPGDARAWTLLGDCERHLGAMAAARAAWDRAVELDETAVGARFNRAVLARLESRADEARADFEWIVEHDASDALRHRQAHLELARLALAAGDRASAEALHARYRELGGTEPLE